jgi:hypothetical protein
MSDEISTGDISKVVRALRDAAAELSPHGGYTRLTIQTEGGSGPKAWTVDLAYLGGSGGSFTAHGSTLPIAITAMGARLVEQVGELENHQRRLGDRVRGCLKGLATS